MRGTEEGDLFIYIKSWWGLVVDVE